MKCDRCGDVASVLVAVKVNELTAILKRQWCIPCVVGRANGPAASVARESAVTGG